MKDKQFKRIWERFRIDSGNQMHEYYYGQELDDRGKIWVNPTFPNDF